MEDKDIKEYDMLLHYNNMELEEVVFRLDAQLKRRIRIMDVQGRIIQLRPQTYSLDEEELEREMEYPLKVGDDWNATNLLYMRIRDIIGFELSRKPAMKRVDPIIEQLKSILGKTGVLERELHQSMSPVKQKIKRKFDKMKVRDDMSYALADNIVELFKLGNVNPFYEVKPHAFELEGLINVLEGYQTGVTTREETIEGLRTLYEITELWNDDIERYANAATVVARGIGSQIRIDEKGSNFWDIGNMMSLLPPREAGHDLDIWWINQFPENSEMRIRFSEQIAKLKFVYDLQASYMEGITGKNRDLNLGRGLSALPWVKEDKSDWLYDIQHKNRDTLISRYQEAFTSLKQAALTFFGEEARIPNGQNISYQEMYRAVEGIGMRKPSFFITAFSPENN